MDLHTSSEGLNAGKKLIESISQNSGIRLKATALGKPLLTHSLTEAGGYTDALACLVFLGLPVCSWHCLHITPRLSWVRARMRWCDL